MITCTFDDGGKGNLRHVTVDVIICLDAKILLVKRSSKLANAPGKYCLPGGYLDKNEFLVGGGAREVKEETGYRIDDLTLFHIRDYPGDIGDNNMQNVGFTFFTKNAKKTNSPIDSDSKESILVPLDSIDKIKDIIAFDHWHILKAFQEHQTTPQNLPIMNIYLKHS